MEPRDRSGPERPYRLVPETTRGPLPSRSRETLPEGLLGASSARAERSRDCGRREMPELGRTTDDPDDQRAGEAGRDVSSFRRVAEATQTRLSPVRQRLARYEHVPVVDVLAGTYRRDRESAGAVIGSAIAFRLFLFFVPLLLLVVGIAGFASELRHCQRRQQDRWDIRSPRGGDQRRVSPARVHTMVGGAVRPVRGADGRPVVEQGPARGERGRVAAAAVRVPGFVAYGRRGCRPDLRHSRDRYSGEPGPRKPGTGSCGPYVCPGPATVWSPSQNPGNDKREHRSGTFLQW